MILENIRSRKTSTLRGAFALVVTLAGVSGLLGIGCGGANLAVLTSHEIAEHGTLVLAGPRNVVLEKDE